MGNVLLAITMAALVIRALKGSEIIRRVRRDR
jgi:hypothetical protein